MDVDAVNKAVVDAHATVGSCAIGFAALEFHTQFLLSILALGKVLSVESVILTEGDSFSQKIKKIRRFAALRRDQIPTHAARAVQLADTLDKLRERRNAFIHGFWLINWGVVSAGIVRCSDTKWRYDKEKNAWRAMSTEDIPITELEKLPIIIEELIKEMTALTGDIEAALNRRGEPTSVSEGDSSAPAHPL